VKEQLSAIFSLPPATDVDEKSLGLQLLVCNTALYRPLYGKFGAIVVGFSATTVNTSSPLRDFWVRISVKIHPHVLSRTQIEL
jgi:hypothetical protein